MNLQAQSDSAADAVTVKDGKIYTVQGDQFDLLTENLKFPFNINISTNGTFKIAGGKERRLEAGQILRRDGWLLNPNGSIEPVFNHVAMQAGRVIVVRDGQAASLMSTMTFPNNLRVAPDGLCVYPDGGSSRLIDGQLFQLDGTAIAPKDTITLKNGRVVVQKDGSLITLAPVQILGMNDGTRVSGSGSIQRRDGSPTQLREGETILVDGVIVRR